jgi:hypothetical protein
MILEQEPNPARRVPVYVAHCLNAPTAEERESNRREAARWVAWLAGRYLVAPVADWILLAGEWPETPEHRSTGLAIDRVLVELVARIVLVGPRVSEGMRFESGWSKTVVDLTGWFRLPDAWAENPAATWDAYEWQWLVDADNMMSVAGLERGA